MTSDIFEDTWDEVDIDVVDVLYDLTNALHNLKLGGRATPPSYVAHYISVHQEKFEDIIGEGLSVNEQKAGGIVFYEVTTEGNDG